MMSMRLSSNMMTFTTIILGLLLTIASTTTKGSHDIAATDNDLDAAAKTPASDLLLDETLYAKLSAAADQEELLYASSSSSSSLCISTYRSLLGVLEETASTTDNETNNRTTTIDIILCPGTLTIPMGIFIINQYVHVRCMGKSGSCVLVGASSPHGHGLFSISMCNSKVQFTGIKFRNESPDIGSLFSISSGTMMCGLEYYDGATVSFFDSSFDYKGRISDATIGVGGLMNVLDHGSTARFFNCTFFFEDSSDGGVIYIRESIDSLLDCMFHTNNNTPMDKNIGVPLPKRPLPAYVLFFEQERRHLLQSDDEVSLSFRELLLTLQNGVIFGRLVEQIGTTWLDLPDSKRLVYHDQASLSKLRYQKQVEEWKNACASSKPQQPLLPFSSLSSRQYNHNHAHDDRCSLYCF